MTIRRFASEELAINNLTFSVVTVEKHRRHFLYIKHSTLADSRKRSWLNTWGIQDEEIWSRLNIAYSVYRLRHQRIRGVDNGNQVWQEIRLTFKKNYQTYKERFQKTTRTWLQTAIVRLIGFSDLRYANNEDFWTEVGYDMLLVDGTKWVNGLLHARYEYSRVVQYVFED